MVVSLYFRETTVETPKWLRFFLLKKKSSNIGKYSRRENSEEAWVNMMLLLAPWQLVGVLPAAEHCRVL